MVVDVLIAQSQAKDPLPQQRRQIMSYLALLTAIVDPPGQARQQAQPPFGQVQQGDTAVGRDLTAGKIKFYPALLTGW
jgi:hypothetical protein